MVALDDDNKHSFGPRARPGVGHATAQESRLHDPSKRARREVLPKARSPYWVELL